MGRYTKISSKYILAKFHQNTSQGTLFERDWTTIGNVHRIEPGKRAVYGSSNFLFTENSLPVYKKKRKSGKWIGSYVYDDVMDSENLVNLIKVNTDSENLCDYAYWGSMTELFRGSVEHIIKTFPGRLRSTKKRLRIHHHIGNNPEYWDEANGYILGNPFDLDMHTTEQNGNVNPDDLLRYIALSWRDYKVEDYERDSVSSIDSYSVYVDYIEYDCEHKYFRLYNVVLFYGKGNFLIIDVYLADGKIVYVYRTEKDQDVPPEWFDFIIKYHSGIGTANSDSDDSSPSADSRALSTDLDDIFNDWYIPSDFGICPNEKAVVAYFRNLEGFEWKLLNTKTKPYYRNTFLLPIQLDNGNWKLVKRTYTWPSEGLWIDSESTDFESFVAGMIDLCEVYDNLWCDSIWRCMVHESVKNFDWSYRREYDDNDVVDNIEGGNRMKDVMRLYGIIYDKAKRFVDGVSMFNTVSYDGYNNCPNAQISDRNHLQGWDITSTQHQFYWYEPCSGILKGDFTPLPVLPVNVSEESPEQVSVTCIGSDADFYVKKTIPVSEISLDSSFYEENTTIVRKGQNPWISTNIYGRLYTEVGLGSVTPAGYDFSRPNRTFNDFPYQLFDGTNYQTFVKVVSNTGNRYYKFLPNTNIIQSNNSRFVNGIWFETVNEKSVTTATTDVLFNRTLNLSSNRILKTKGTKEAIEMVFALFGFGRFDNKENPNGDYIIEEQYSRYTAKTFDSTFYFYEVIEPEEAAGYIVITVDELPKNPTKNIDPNFVKIVTDTGNGSSFETYYRLNGQYTVGEAVKLLYAHRTTERVYNDYYSGVPINDEYRGTKHLVIPFMDSNRVYEGNPYFEGNGGWMKTGENTWDYSETIPYLHILQRISDLFMVNPSSLSDDDIYFVADVSDYYTYTDNVPYYLSNYFKLVDKYNSTSFSSWTNVPIEGPLENGGNPGIEGVTREDYLHAKHLDEIIPSILFNNPHCGYDRYDMGDTYKDYITNPYRYSAENELYDDDYYANMASQFTFDSTSFYTNTDDGKYDSKTVVTAQTSDYVSTSPESRRYGGRKREDDEDVTATTTTTTGTPLQTADEDYVYMNDKYLKITLMDNGSPIDSSNKAYRLHLEYMRNVVMKYVVQVVPSTTLLVLDNFITPELESNDTATITVNIDGEGVVYGSGTYLKTSMITLKAVPEEGWHFYGWRSFGGRSTSPSTTTEAEPFGSYDDTITVMVCEDDTYIAVFAEDCAIGYGCNVINCSGSAPLD